MSAVYSALNEGCICRICSKQGKPGKKWSTEQIKLWGHPTRTFETHKNSKGHNKSLQKQTDVKKMLVKQNIYQQAVRRSAKTKAKRHTL